MYDLLVFVAVPLAGVLADRLMGHHKPWARENFPKGIEVHKRGLLMSAYLGFSMIFSGLMTEGSPILVTTTIFLMLANLLLLVRMFRFEWWYEDFKWA
ncbi:MAG TPA: hypothetical protein VMU11_01615 [Verrucomicrobiae bacterium]|nr:hypothetical protein [Verrucomicrobiae bacterium]